MGAPRKLVLYIASSLDGFIARRDGGVDWLPTGGKEDYGYASFLSTVDTVIMGRRTYGQMLTFGPFPYVGKECFVFSRHREGSDGNVEFVGRDIGSFMAELRSRPGKDLWLVGGADLARAFFREGEVEEVVLTIVPHLLGDGIALFEAGGPEIGLELKETRAYPQGLVQLRYEVRRSAPDPHPSSSPASSTGRKSN